MSEFIRCDCCGDLTSFEDTVFINNSPLCTDCVAEKDDLLILAKNNYA